MEGLLVGGKVVPVELVKGLLVGPEVVPVDLVKGLLVGPEVVPEELAKGLLEVCEVVPEELAVAQAGRVELDEVIASDVLASFDPNFRQRTATRSTPLSSDSGSVSELDGADLFLGRLFAFGVI